MEPAVRLTALLGRLDRALARVETALVVACLGLGALFSFLLVFGRNLLDRSYNALDELAVYLIIWMVFVGAVLADRGRQHISLDITYHLIPEAARRPLRRLADGLQGALGLSLAWLCYDAVRFSYRIGETSVSTLEAPIWIAMAVMPPAFLLLGLRAALRAVLPSREDTAEARKATGI